MQSDFSLLSDVVVLNCTYVVPCLTLSCCQYSPLRACWCLCTITLSSFCCLSQASPPRPREPLFQSNTNTTLLSFFPFNCLSPASPPPKEPLSQSGSPAVKERLEKLHLPPTVVPSTSCTERRRRRCARWWSSESR